MTKKKVITDFSQLTESVVVRVEEVEIEQDSGDVLVFFVREMKAEHVTEFQKSVPDVQIEEVGEGKNKKMVKTILNSTNRTDAARIVSNIVVTGSDNLKLLKGGSNGAKEWAQLPNRILEPLLEKGLELSNLRDSKEETEGKEEDS